MFWLLRWALAETLQHNKTTILGLQAAALRPDPELMPDWDRYIFIQVASPIFLFSYSCQSQHNSRWFANILHCMNATNLINTLSSYHQLMMATTTDLCQSALELDSRPRLSSAYRPVVTDNIHVTSACWWCIPEIAGDEAMKQYSI